MTTITIDQKTNLKSHYSSEIELAEDLLESMGYVLLHPVKNPEIIAKVETHREENQNREKSSFDNI